EWKSHLSQGRGLIGPPTWMGSLIEGGRDLTGQMYMRNRFYDPASGRFTQEDPIGTAGGLNVYGFANGDPVSYSDPYGLCSKEDGWKDCAATFRDWLRHSEDGKLLTAVVCTDGCEGSTPEAQAAVDEAMEKYPIFMLSVRGEAEEGIHVLEHAGTVGRAIAGQITGYTKHGINQAISRNGVGVSTRAILSAVATPLKAISNRGGGMKYIGENATVILSEAGKVITTWARNASGWRIVP
ncbi:MAG: wapA, partial [Gemmatimonadetes bacterium]|nr:wapA [Gemmatimonadota bacterium]